VDFACAVKAVEVSATKETYPTTLYVATLQAMKLHSVTLQAMKLCLMKLYPTEARPVKTVAEREGKWKLPSQYRQGRRIYPRRARRTRKRAGLRHRFFSTMLVPMSEMSVLAPMSPLSVLAPFV
jgi:hypothetical protein